MKKTSVIVVFILILLVGLNVYQYYRYNQFEENSPIPISELKGENQESFIGKIATVEGYFVLVANKHPILVSSIDVLMVNNRIPDDEFVSLANLKYEEYAGIAGSFVHTKGKVIEIAEHGIGLEVTKINTIVPASTPYSDLLEPATIPWEQVELPSNKYAVLISGGIDSTNAHNRYWNDMKYMYQILNNSYGYDPDNIFVIYKDGVAEDNDMPVHFSATTTNVINVFNTLANTLTRRDQLFIFMDNHGGGFNPNDPKKNYLYGGIVDLDGDEPEPGYSESTYNIDINGDDDKFDTVRIDETLWLYFDQVMSDDEMADLIDSIECNRMIIFMEQCFSGGFIRDLSGPNRIILSACSEERFSYAHPPDYTYNEFSFHFMKAVNGEDWSADTNNDNRISMVEAFNYASNKDSEVELPHYDDDGNGVGHAVAVPNGGDGIAGTNAFL